MNADISLPVCSKQYVERLQVGSLYLCLQLLLICRKSEKFSCNRAQLVARHHCLSIKKQGRCGAMGQWNRSCSHASDL